MRKFTIPSTATLVAAVLLAGCGPSQHAVSWYKAHPKIAAKKAAWCNNDAARVVTADCQNAINANAEIKTWGVPGHTGYTVHLGQ